MGIIWDGVKAVGKGIGHAAYAGLEGIGGLTYAAGKRAAKAAPGMAEALGGASFSGAETVGQAALNGVKTTGTMALGAGSYMGKLIDINPEKYTNSIFGARLTGTGKAIVMGAGLVGGTVGAYRDYETTQMGIPSGEIASPTPRMNYTHFGEEMGATGDLVFAMNRNRRGY